MRASIACLLIRRTVSFIAIICACLQIKGQLKWDGGAGDGLWNTPANWIGDMIPGATDDVLLDHSIVSGNYVVTLPSGMTTVIVRKLVISPSVPQTIEVRLPATNTAIPAFTATGSVYGLEINNGGIFKNSSGASAGTPVDISDSIKIYNGGWFIHNTSRAHAGNVTVLSKAPGTEQGSFEFDVPGGSGYTVSIAGRVYGNLILSAAAAGGAKSYTSTGTTAVNINGQFQINPGANYSLNFNGMFIIHGDFLHQGNVFDISGGLHSNRINFRKNLSVSGTITETGTGLPMIELDGNTAQNIFVTGGITDSIAIKLNNAAGISLQTPMSVSYKLELVRGNVRTTQTKVLIIRDNTGCTGGSVNSFVEGPMRKLGDDDFEFPIGKQGIYAPASISGIGGDVNDEFEAEYFHGNPATIFGTAFENPPIVRISALEYWKVERVVGTSAKKVTLSVGTYSNATLLEKLLVTRWDTPGNIWKDEGNSAYSGIATGIITSSDLQSFGVLTIASTVQNQNPLPAVPFSFNASLRDKHATLKWRADPSLDVQRFEVLRSDNKIHFRLVETIEALPAKSEYEFVEILSTQGIYYYKIMMIEKNGNVYQSNIRSIVSTKNRIELEAVTVVVNEILHLTLNAPGMTVVDIIVLNAEGKTLRKISTQLQSRSQNLAIDLSAIPVGVYYVTAVAKGIKTNVVRFVKVR